MNQMKSEAELQYQRGNALAQLRRMDEAGEAYDQCLALDPAHLGALNNRALVLVQQQRWDEALRALDGIVLKFPEMADAWNNRSGVLQALGRHEESLESIAQVLRLRPRDPRALYNAGITLLLLKRFDEAQRALAQVLEIVPGQADALANLVSAALRACDWHSLERLMPQILPRVADGSVVLAPLSLLALSDDPDLQKRCAQTNTRRFLAQAGLDGVMPEPLAKASYGHDRLRIGYLSSDFRDHPVASQLIGLLERHDRSRFEVIGLSTGRADGSHRRQRIVKACDRFHDVSGTGSAEIATLIRDLEVDILVDLNGQTLGWRPAILKYRPASVIAGFLGYAGTSGAEFVDYIIGDPQVTPFSLAPALTEKIVQLPHSFWPSDPDLPEPEAVSRAQAGLPPDAFVFCCFNSNHKIRPEIFDIWARLLKAVPGSVLWIRDAGMNARFRHQAELRGVDPDRILFAARMDSFARHLGRQALADLFLDTYPYNAHATASDALWAGLPIVTLRGESFVSRVTAGFLANLGLDELIATTPQDYESIALSLARDGGRLRDIRQRLAQARKSSPLFDADRFARGIEAAYLEMHRRVRQGLEPESFHAGDLSQGTLNN